MSYQRVGAGQYRDSRTGQVVNSAQTPIAQTQRLPQPPARPGGGAGFQPMQPMPQQPMQQQPGYARPGGGAGFQRPQPIGFSGDPTMPQNPFTAGPYMGQMPQGGFDSQGMPQGNDPGFSMSPQQQQEMMGQMQGGLSGMQFNQSSPPVQQNYNDLVARFPNMQQQMGGLMGGSGTSQARLPKPASPQGLLSQPPQKMQRVSPGMYRDPSGRIVRQ